MSGLSLRFVKEWDIERDAHPVHITWVPRSLVEPLAGHSGSCAKVMQATVTGQMTAECDCQQPLEGHAFDCGKVAHAMMTGQMTGDCDCQERA